MDDELFDWSLYGSLVRHARTKLGYKTTTAFSETLYRRTRLSISKDVLYRVEQGRQQPTAMQFLAINLALFNEVLPLNRIDISACLSTKWREYNENEDMPTDWRAENLLNAYEDIGFVSDTGLNCVFEQDLPDDESVYITPSDYLDSGAWFEIQKTDEYGVISGTVRAVSGDIHLCV